MVRRVLLPAAIAALPLVLLWSSLRTFHELDEQRTVYLRQRVAMLAARLERVPAGSPDSVVEALSEDEPNLVDAAVIAPGGEGDEASLAAIWGGQELFRTESVARAGGGIFRAYVPFHSAQGLRIARIDLRAAAADFLVLHARHNLIAASLGGLVLVALSIYAVWATRRAAALRLRQMQMEHLAHIGKMAAALAHEIRNPLGTIKGFAQLAAERAPAASQELLKPILSETQRLEGLVTDLLAYGRPPVAHPRSVEWKEIARAVESHARQWIGARPIQLSVPEADLRWQTDPLLLQQALLNLVRNAVEAIQEASGGEICLEAAITDGNGLRITVADDGAGIPAEVRAKLFEPFFTTKPFGTGLGLAITRKLLETLGGTLELRAAPGGGTEAVIIFASALAEAPAIVLGHHGNHSDRG